MKLTELKCTACNGTLKIDEQNPHIAVCEYCRTRYVLEDEGEGNVRLAQEPKKINYVPIPPSPPEKPRGWGPYGWKRATALAAAFFLILAVVYGPGMKRRWDMDHASGKAAVTAGREAGGKNGTMNTGKPGEKGAPEEAVQEETELTGMFADVASIALGKGADSLTDEELASFRWLEYKYSSDSVLAGYSFENPRQNPDASLIWLEFDRDKTDINMKALSRFNGLKVLSVAGYVSPGNLDGLELESLGCYGKTPAEVAAVIENPGQLKELRIKAGLENLEGLSEFGGLEHLSIGGSKLQDIKALAAMKGLKALTLEYSNEVKDFSVLSVMTWLEELSIESEGVKDIGFVKNMPQLHSLSLSKAQILNLDSLKGNESLKALSVTRCGEVKDLSAVSGLAGLESLTLEVPYNCPKPGLAGLTRLKSLSLDGMDTVGYLSGMTELEDLTLEWVTIDSKAPFAGLKNLKRLQCSRIPNDTSWSFVTGIPALEVLNLNGVATYEDISGLFGMPSLKELYLNGIECELNFSKLTPNMNLEVLKMDGVKLYKNVKISGGGGIVYVDYDNVSLDENTGFLAAYGGLKRLSLSDNTLTNVEFASSLKNLELLDISGNYVTDLKPLEGLGNLRMLDAEGNPVENYRVLSEDVVIIQ